MNPKRRDRIDRYYSGKKKEELVREIISCDSEIRKVRSEYDTMKDMAIKANHRVDSLLTDNANLKEMLSHMKFALTTVEKCLKK